MLSATEIRQTFLDFFKSKGHEIVPSAPIVVKNDPTLMFTNAGMNQFKDYFIGNDVAKNSRIADTQKCLRVSGKHNDLEEVGVDTYHHTMFEMLGNWSFGDYFKKEAIEWSWELLTEVFKINKDILYVTIFEGDDNENIPKDTESFMFWKELVPEDRILLGNKKDNFWEMGEIGPCGPCTEIHVDCRPESERAKIDGRILVNQDDPQVIEIWNNVFIQFNRMKDGSLQPLPAMHVDTGMGFERLVRVLQNKTSNYDTDIFTPTIDLVESITSKKYTNSHSKQDVAFRVLADHIRAICFTITDGQLPSNTGAGYVIRRILRRAVRYYYSYLDFQKPLLHLLVDALAVQFEHVFPELITQKVFVEKVIKEEEEVFLKTLEKGLKRLDDILNSNIEKIEGKIAFELYDTYGFPLDLTHLIAYEKGINVDENEFDIEMQKQKDRSREATVIDTSDWKIIHASEEVKFVGYTNLVSTSKILRYRQIQIKGQNQYQLVLDITPFYAESGGQVGDTGVLKYKDKTLLIEEVKKENNLILHFTSQNPDTFLNLELISEVDETQRRFVESNHSATHLLHAALRETLGTHVEQKGSLVNSKALRFDFSHFNKISDEEIQIIESKVNEKIREKIDVEITEMTKVEAVNQGAMALFGEKYGDLVRVVKIDSSFSIELCGGTHVKNTSEINLFKIISEGSVATGVRRIEAITNVAAIDYLNKELNTLKQIKEQFKSKDILKEILKLKEDNSNLLKEVVSFKQKEISQIANKLTEKAKNINNINYIILQIDGYSMDDLKQIGFQLKSKVENFVITLSGSFLDKFNVLIMLDEKFQQEKKWNASEVLKKEIAPLIQGGGGGQATLATGAGKVPMALVDLDTIILNSFNA